MKLSLRSVLLLSVVLVSCLFLFGCINNTITNNGYSQEYLNNLNRTALFDSNTIGNCTLGSCWCMTCQNGSSFFGYFSSMIGGRCSFDKACTPERFGSIINQSFNTSISVRSFMIGQGPTFADFGAATPYCNN